MAQREKYGSWRIVCLLLAMAGIDTASAEEIPAGPGKIEIELDGTKHDLFTYRPAEYDPKNSPLVIVIHGTGDTGEKYRDHGKPMGDRFNALIVAPRLPPKQYPLHAYHWGNLRTKAGKMNPRKDWTWELIPRFAEEIRHRAGSPKQPLILIGHSAGGQFLVRLAAFTDFPVDRIVAANPGTHLFPTRDLPYPYGFGGLPDELSNDEALKRYLARPLTLYQGVSDTIQDALFDVGPTAMTQGSTRIERGRNSFAMGKKLAEEKGWAFHWRLVEVPRVGHSGGRMFAHEKCKEAIAIEPAAVTVPAGN